MKSALTALLFLMNSAVLAQTTGTISPSATPAESSGKEDVAPGSCMPIGMTASGEMVFPIQCRELIEQHRGKVGEQNPVAVEEKKPAQQSETPAPESSEPPIKPVETVKPVEATPEPKHAEPKRRERVVRRGGCQSFETYDPKSDTYKGYDGQRHPCW
jgi:BA14K-like protein